MDLFPCSVPFRPIFTRYYWNTPGGTGSSGSVWHLAPTASLKASLLFLFASSRALTFFLSSHMSTAQAHQAKRTFASKPFDDGSPRFGKTAFSLPTSARRDTNARSSLKRMVLCVLPTVHFIKQLRCVASLHSHQVTIQNQQRQSFCMHGLAIIIVITIMMIVTVAVVGWDETAETCVNSANKAAGFMILTVLPFSVCVRCVHLCHCIRNPSASVRTAAADPGGGDRVTRRMVPERKNGGKRANIYGVSETKKGMRKG